MKTRAQSTLEYTVLIVVVAAALFAMQAYFKRSLQGRLRGNADELSGGSAYAPGATTSTSTLSRAIREKSSSETVKENNTLGDVNETSVSKSSVTINQTMVRNEEVK